MPDPVVPAVASTGLAGLLLGPDVSGHVLGVTGAAVYLRFPPVSVVALEVPGAVGLPCALTVDTADHLAGTFPGAPASVGGGRLGVGRTQFRVARWRDPRPLLLTTTVEALAARCSQAQALLPVPGDPVAARVEAGLDALVDAAIDGDHDRGLAVAGGLLGLGPGSTPSGDDVLAGLVAAGQLLAPVVPETSRPMAAWFARLGAAVAARAVERTPALSACLLWHASRGEVARPAGDLLEALTDRGDVPPALSALLAVGHRSGVDLALGILAAARAVTARGSIPAGEVPRA